MSKASTSPDFMAGGGEMGALMRGHDWASSALGSPETWPQSLRLTVRVILNTGHPMFIWWGPDLIQFYNDAYRLTMGPERHPSALGQEGRVCWAEIWPIIGPQIEYVIAGHGSTWDEDRLVPVTRHGRLEQVWWTYSYGPIDQEGAVGGVLVVCNDVTQQHLAAERLEDQTRRIMQLFEQAPGFMAVLRGPEHVIELANAAYRRLIGERAFVGKPVRTVIPDLEGQGFFELLDTVYREGEHFVGRRMPIVLQENQHDTPTRAYLDFVFQPIVDADGKTSGIFVEGSDVTAHVKAENHLQLINLELKHRVKNTLAMVSAIANRTFVGTGRDAALTVFRDRLAIFGKAHDILTSTTWATAEIGDVVDAALAAHRSSPKRIAVSGPRIIMGSKQAVSLALAIHELATNAIKYGALSNDQGTVDIRWEQGSDGGGEMFKFSWSERGGPMVKPPRRQGFGSKLIERVLRADFNADLTMTFDQAGIVCAMTTAAANLNDTTPNKVGLDDA